MSANAGIQVAQVAATDEQIQRAYELIQEDPSLGHAHALRQAGVAGTKGQLAAYIEQHPELRDELNGARCDRIRKAWLERAIDGVEEPIVSVKGEIVGYRRVYSDRLLDLAVRVFLSEAQVLQRGRLEVTGQGGGPVTVSHERRLTLADVLTLSERLDGLGASAGLGVPAARPVLAQPHEDQPATSALPPRSQS